MRLLYKYQSLDGARINWLERMLSGWVYYASPLSFNDPFEISPTFLAPDEKAVAKFLDKQELGISKSLRARVIKDSLSKLRSVHVAAVEADWVGELGVLCLTNDHKNLLMWSHYAGSHSGICIGFDASFYPLSTAKAIRYTSERPQVPLVEGPVVNDAIIESIFLSKSPHWKYEAEWRSIKRPVRESEKDFYKKSLDSGDMNDEEVAELLASEGGAGLYECDPRAIKRIVFGAKIRSEYKARIIDMISKMSWVKLFQAELDKRHFVLNINEIKR